ncbi:MAG: cupin domain-containing protein [Gemmatimonadota bacterium]
MPSIDRPLNSELLHFRFEDELARLKDPESATDRRTGRTLVKGDRLRVVLVTLGAGGRIAEHESAGRITIQPISGTIRFEAGDEVRNVATGELLSVDGGVRHAVESSGGAAFLLTIARP